MTDQESFGIFLRHLRESKGLSLRQAAKQAGISSGYLSQIEGENRGKRKTGEQFAPHPQIIRQLADVYHVPAQDLFDRAGFFEEKKDYLGFSEEKETNRCFDLVIHDPVLRRTLTTADKKAIIERYEALSGRKLITWAGENSLLNKKPEYKGLQMQDGALYAQTVQVTLTLEEVAQELGIEVDELKTLIQHGHIYVLKTTKGPPVIEKAEIRQLKEFAIREGLKLLFVRHRKDRPQTPEDYEQADAEIGKRALEKIAKKAEREFPERMKGQRKRAKKKTQKQSKVFLAEKGTPED